jgi:hypothetical protein
MPRARRLLAVSLVSFAFLAAGCGRGYQLAPVSGKVTMDNRPLAGAEVSFYPVAGGKDVPYASGTTDEQGNFKLAVLVNGGTADGAVVGENRVMISQNRINGPKKLLPKEMAGNHDQVPAKYNRDSTLTFTVPAGGSTTADFALTSR